MDRRTHQRVAWELSALGRALRPLAHHLWRVLSYRLLHDRLTQGCAIASSRLECRILAVFKGAGFSSMPNSLQRRYGQGELHFITFSCFRRRPLLGAAPARDCFLRILERV